MKRIFIVDDHKMFIEGISSMLKNNREFKVIGYALSGEDFLKNKQNYAYDILILDIHLPKMSGLDLANLMRKERPELKIVVLSMVDSHSLILQFKSMKVDGFLTKNSGIADILHCLSDVVNKKTSFPSQTEAKKKAIIQNTKYLTKREIEVVRQISKGGSNKQIAENLFISISTVETHRKNIIQKLGTKNVAELLRFATKEGII